MVSDGPGIIQSMRDTGMITLNILQEVQSIFISELDPDKNVTSLSLSEIIPNPTRTHLYDWCSLQMEQCARAWSLTTGNDPGMSPPRHWMSLPLRVPIYCTVGRNHGCHTRNTIALLSKADKALWAPRPSTLFEVTESYLISLIDCPPVYPARHINSGQSCRRVNLLVAFLIVWNLVKFAKARRR